MQVDELQEVVSRGLHACCAERAASDACCCAGSLL